MKIVLEVKENKVDFLLALLNDLPYVKAIPIDEHEESYLLDEIVSTRPSTYFVSAV